MRLEVIDKDNYKVFLNSDYIEEFDSFYNGYNGSDDAAPFRKTLQRDSD